MLACDFQHTHRNSQLWQTNQEGRNRVPFYHLGYSTYIQIHAHTQTIQCQHVGISTATFVLAVLGLCCCARAFFQLQGVGFSLPWLLWLPITSSTCAASVVATLEINRCGLLALEHGLSSRGTWAQLLCGLWNLLRPGAK